MRNTSWLLGLILLTLASSASAQGTGSVTIDSVTRENSPRAREFVDHDIPSTEPIGVRDCSCETWRFRGTYVRPPEALTVSFWVGTSPTACASLANRQPGLATTRCWRVEGVDVLPVASDGTFDVVVPARWLVDPAQGQCVPPPGLSHAGALYFSVLLMPPDDESVMASTAVLFDVARSAESPPAPTNVRASQQDEQMEVAWSLAGTSPDSDAGATPATIRGYYVLCTPRPASFDAGAGPSAGETCAPLGGSTPGDGGVPDAGTGADPSDGGVQACDGVADFPANFDPNDDALLNQYRCSERIDRAATSAIVAGLTRGTRYRVAVVSEDYAGNRSMLSSTRPCTSPLGVMAPADSDAGASGGLRGGSCAVKPGAAPARAGAFAAVGLLVGAAIARRRARRGKAESKVE